MTAPVAIHPRALRAYGLRIGALFAGSVVIGDSGAVLRVRADGGLDEVLAGGYPRPGIASDPTATRGARP